MQHGKIDLVEKDQLILIPSFFYIGMNRNSLSFDDVLNLDKIKDLFSLEDLCYVYLLNESSSIVLQDNNFNYLLDYWSKSSYFEQIQLTKNIQQGELKTRFSEVSNYQNNQEPFTLKDNATDVVFCIIYPTFFAEDKFSENSNSLITQILKLLYGYNTYDCVAKYPLFKRYLKLLSNCNV